MEVDCLDSTYLCTFCMLFEEQVNHMDINLTSSEQVLSAIWMN